MIPTRLRTQIVKMNSFFKRYKPSEFKDAFFFTVKYLRFCLLPDVLQQTSKVGVFLLNCSLNLTLPLEINRAIKHVEFSYPFQTFL